MKNLDDIAFGIEKSKALAINRSSLQLKEKETITFEKWLFNNGIRYVSDHTYKNAKGTLYAQEELQVMYGKYINL